MTNTERLAEALRLAREWFNHLEADEGPQAHEVIAAADAALAAHESSQQAAHDAGESASIEEWEQELSAVMPADFKDWWQNSKREWPAVAAEVIRSLRKDRDWWREAAGRAQRQPLTDAQIAEGRYRMWADELEDAPEPWAFLKGARWAERYYGIGGATTGEQR